MATATVITSAEFLARPDEFDQSGNRIKEELIGGEIVKMASASKHHDRQKNRIARIIGRYLDAIPQPAVDVLVQISFEVSERDSFTPDVAVIRIGRFDEEGRVIKGAPEIAVEVVSPTDTAKDIRKKTKAYLENGAGSVWIFYDDGSVAVHTATGVRELTGDQPLEDPLLPGFSLPVSTFYLLP
jgi:Uma2 family endonuclease